MSGSWRTSKPRSVTTRICGSWRTRSFIANVWMRYFLPAPIFRLSSTPKIPTSHIWTARVSTSTPSCAGLSPMALEHGTNGFRRGLFCASSALAVYVFASGRQGMAVPRATAEPAGLTEVEEGLVMNVVIPDWAAVRTAWQFLKRHFAPTRLILAPSLTRDDGAGVYLKVESELPTGSFKVRGAVYALHAEMARRPVAVVVASSTGNHGAAVAWAAKSIGIPAKIFLPSGANPAKQSRICALGAEIVEHGKDISEAAEAAEQYSI